jgi:hypothetical protein
MVFAYSMVIKGLSEEEKENLSVSLNIKRASETGARRYAIRGLRNSALKD